MSTAAAIILFAAVTMYAIFGGADFGAGFWDLTAGGAERGKRPREVIDHSIGPVWEANHVWLIFVLRRLVDVLPGGVRVDHLDHVRTPHARGVRHRATRRKFCFSQSGVSNPCPAPLRSHLRRFFGLGALLFRRYRGRDCLRAGARRWASRRSGDQLDQPNLDRCWLAGRLCDGVRRRSLPHLGRRAALRRHDGRVLPHPRNGSGRRGWSRCHRRPVRGAQRCQLPLRRTHVARPASGRRVGASRAWRARAASGSAASRGAGGSGRCRGGTRPRVGSCPVGLPASRIADGVAGGSAVRNDHGSARRGRLSPRS